MTTDCGDGSPHSLFSFLTKVEMAIHKVLFFLPLVHLVLGRHWPHYLAMLAIVGGVLFSKQSKVSAQNLARAIVGEYQHRQGLSFLSALGQ